jgi:hypothetical protein
VIQEAQLRLTLAGLQRLLASAVLPAAEATTPGAFSAVFLGLFKEWSGFGLDLQTESLIIPGYTGYARQALVWGPPGLDAQGRPAITAGSLVFSPTDALASSGVKGCAIFDAANAGVVLAAGVFKTPFTLASPLDDATVIAKIAMPGLDRTDWGSFNLVR